jgi:hypothetical protein
VFIWNAEQHGNCTVCSEEVNCSADCKHGNYTVFICADWKIRCVYLVEWKAVQNYAANGMTVDISHTVGGSAVSREFQCFVHASFYID